MPNRTLLCPVDVLPPGGMLRLEPGGFDPILLVDDDGVLRALDDDCTHAIASLAAGRREGHILFCPLHGGSFDLRTGKACSLPCRQPLRTYATEVSEGMVWLVG